MALVIRPDSRVERWLRRLGVDYTVDAHAAHRFADHNRPLRVTSPFPFHQVRQILHTLGRSPSTLTCTDAEGEAWRNILLRLDGAPRLDGEGDFDDQAPPLDGLESALDAHQALEVVLASHRISLMRTDLTAARHHWTTFANLLRHHLAIEDERVMPRYEALAPVEGWARGAAPEVVDREHDKIRNRLMTLERALDDLIDRPGDETQLACLALLDRQKVFQDLLEHHDLRERRSIYPHLERHLSASEKAALVADLLAWPKHGRLTT